MVGTYGTYVHVYVEYVYSNIHMYICLLYVCIVEYVNTYVCMYVLPMFILTCTVHRNNVCRGVESTCS